MTVRNQFTTDVWFAQRKLEQTGDPINPATARRRHAVKCMRHAAHTAIACRTGVFIPSIAMPAADADPMSTEEFDCFECPGQFGRDRESRKHVRVFEQLPDSGW